MDEYTPHDYLEPLFAKEDHVHNWRNYVSDELRDMWHTFTDDQKAAIARSCEHQANSEDWD